MKNLTIIPLGTPDTLTDAVRGALSSVEALYLQTAEHPVSRLALDAGIIPPNAVTLDELYNLSYDFDELNERIADRLFNEQKDEVGLAVLGRGAGEALVKALYLRARDAGVKLTLLPSAGFSSSALAAAFTQGAVEYFSDYSLMSARQLRLTETEQPIVIEEVDTLLAAGEVKLALCEYYPDEFTVALASMEKSGGYSVISLPIHALDHVENASLYGADAVIIVPGLELIRRERHGLDSLMQVMYTLRAPGGCPWDAEQTHASLRSSLIEEAYEVLDAIDSGDLAALEEELGDLLLQVVFHAVIEEEKSEFTMRDVTSGIVNKLIYRHPHVFADVKVSGSDDVLYNWENLKKKEKHQSTVADAMLAVPASFPSLLRSGKVQKKAAHVGFDWPNAAEALPKVFEEAREVEAAINGGTEQERFEEMGDLLFACVNVARLLKLDPELALKAATDKFMRRFIKMEQLILSEGRSFAEMSLDEMDIYWSRIKKSE